MRGLRRGGFELLDFFRAGSTRTLGAEHAVTGLRFCRSGFGDQDYLPLNQHGTSAT